MHLSRRTAVGLGLRLGNQPVGSLCILTDRLRQGEAVDESVNLCRSAVMMMVVVVMMVAVMVMPLLLTVDAHRHMNAGDAPARDRLRFHCHAGHQTVHDMQKVFLFFVQFKQRTHQHIACRAHGALPIQRPHVSSTPFIWLIRLARNPAPKPLSIFTTLIPLAQELSIASSAATPPRLAP